MTPLPVKVYIEPTVSGLLRANDVVQPRLTTATVETPVKYSIANTICAESWSAAARPPVHTRSYPIYCSHLCGFMLAFIAVRDGTDLVVSPTSLCYSNWKTVPVRVERTRASL